MAVTYSTATAAQVKAVVKTAMSTEDIEILLDYVVYPIVDTWVGGHSLVDHAQRVTGAELIMACYFVRQRDPSSVAAPGIKLAFHDYASAERMARTMINSSIPYNKAIRIVNQTGGEGGYILRDLDKPRSHSPPF